MIIIDIIAIIFLFTAFAASHTWLASIKIKKALADNIGSKIAFYRLFYNLSSFLFFGIFYVLAPKPDVIVYDLHYPFDIITFALQVLSLIGIVWAIKHVDIKEFLGITQVKRYYKDEYKPDELDAIETFNVKDAFKIVRHPVYFFSILFLGLRPTMSLFYLIMFVCIAVYFYIGSIYEEKKLLEKFGDEYKEYQKKVPRLFPIKIFK
jgi:steroid 5-alpha reductase family enzyme